MISKARLACALSVGLALVSTVRESGAQLSAELVAAGLDRPVYVTHAPGDGDRLFLVEQPGRIKILRDGVVLERPFLDITDIVYDGGERGCLGLAFDPAYESNGYFYVYFIRGSGLGSSVVRRWTVSSDPDRADEATMTGIFRLGQLGENHNGGHIEFGPDGFLYLGLGDGGGQGDPRDLGQDPGSLFGKMLRIDVRQDGFPGDPSRNYSIPASNPFVGDPATLDEIWALGLRNPYRFCFDRANGDLYLGDVGQWSFEEIDYQPAASPGGENYGWRLLEGEHCHEPPQACDPGGLVAPVHEYDHSTGLAVTGGRVYRGASIAALRGRYLFADFITDRVWSLRIENGQAIDLREHSEELVAGGGGGLANIVGFGEDLVGELYVVDLGGLGTGELYRIVQDPRTPVSVLAPEPRLTIQGGFPNPFRSSTRFEIDRTFSAELVASVHDGAGRLVRQLRARPGSPGRAFLEWDGRDDRDRPAPGGVYFLRVKARGETISKRLVLIR